MILEHIEGPWDVKNLSPEELKDTGCGDPAVPD